MVEVEVAEVSGNGAKHEPCFRFGVSVTAVMFTEGHLDHEPHEPVQDDQEITVNDLNMVYWPSHLEYQWYIVGKYTIDLLEVVTVDIHSGLHENTFFACIVPVWVGG